MPEYILPAHAHRHERHLKFFPDLKKCYHWFTCLFLSSPFIPGLGFGTLIRHFAYSFCRIGCQGFTEPNLSALLNKNQTPLMEGIFDL
jgi:hypothetical protein